MPCYKPSDRPLFQLVVWSKRFELDDRNPARFFADPLFIDRFLREGERYVQQHENAQMRKAMLGILQSIAEVAARTRQMRLAMYLAHAQGMPTA